MLLMYDAYSMRYLRTIQISSSYTDLTLPRTVRTQLCGFASRSFPPTSTAAKLSPGFTFTPSRPLILELLPFSQLTFPLHPPRAPSHLSSSLGLIN